MIDTPALILRIAYQALDSLQAADDELVVLRHEIQRLISVAKHLGRTIYDFEG